MFKLSGVSYWKPYTFNNISFIFGIGYCFWFNCLFKFLNSLRKYTRFDLGLGCAKDGAPHSESFATSRNTSRNKLSTSFWTFSCVPSVLDTVASILASHPFLILSLLGTFSRYQVSHQTTLRFSVIILAICYVVLFSYADIEFP